jgi:hypothetical protein
MHDEIPAIYCRKIDRLSMRSRSDEVIYKSLDGAGMLCRVTSSAFAFCVMLDPRSGMRTGDGMRESMNHLQRPAEGLMLGSGESNAR